MSNTLVSMLDIMTENLHEVALDQVKTGMCVLVVPEGGNPYVCTANRRRLEDWDAWGKARRFFLAEKPAPEYEPGTLAGITSAETGDSYVAFRVYTDGNKRFWVDTQGDMWNDADVSKVEVIADPDGNSPGQEITDGLVTEFRRVITLFYQQTFNDQDAYRCALEAFVAGELDGGQA